jgi:hypothetical protein
MRACRPSGRPTRHDRLATGTVGQPRYRRRPRACRRVCRRGHSGARLDRPGLDALRDAAEGSLFEQVWCLSPDRLARVCAYQVLVLDELARLGVSVRFTDAPNLATDDPQAVLLTQVQGVIAEYEKAKIAERYRRGKLFRVARSMLVVKQPEMGEQVALIAPIDLSLRAPGDDLHRGCKPLNGLSSASASIRDLASARKLTRWQWPVKLNSGTW